VSSLKRLVRLTAWRAISALPARDVVLITANGSLAVRNKDWLIGKTLYVDRGFESEGINAWVGALTARGWLPPERSTVVDAGANIGMISIAMLLRGHFRHAIAFEPAPDSFRLLAANTVRNALGERVRIAQLALSSAAGEADLGLSPDNSGDNRIEMDGSQRGWYREERRPRVRVATSAFDAWLAASGADVGEIGLLWMDVQGHDAHVLAGARSLLGRVPVVMELWPYALERSGPWVAALVALSSERSGGFLSSPRAELRDPRDLPAFAESLGPSPRTMCQIALAPLP
jgi:FkbM family methyltransferase